MAPHPACAVALPRPPRIFLVARRGISMMKVPGKRAGLTGVKVLGEDILTPLECQGTPLGPPAGGGAGKPPGPVGPSMTRVLDLAKRRGAAATISVENYLKAIYHQSQGGQGVIAARLAETLGVSPPAVTSAVRRLARRGYVTVDRRKTISLTAEGLEVARHLICRHRLVERLLTDVLGMEWFRVHEEAERIEHAISPDVEARLMRVFGDRRVCPHGSSFFPEGTEPRRRRGESLLAEASVNESFQVAEVDDEERAFLEYLDGLGIVPGTRLILRERLFDGTLRLQVNGRSVHLGKDSAARVWVRPLAAPRGRAASR